MHIEKVIFLPLHFKLLREKLITLPTIDVFYQRPKAKEKSLFLRKLQNILLFYTTPKCERGEKSVKM